MGWGAAAISIPLASPLETERERYNGLFRESILSAPLLDKRKAALADGLCLDGPIQEIDAG